jgi:superfamily II DNA/RNA helicase
MTPEIQALEFDQLRTLHREIGALIAEKRSEALEQLKIQMSALGFSVDDITGKKQRRKRRKQIDEDDPSS